MVGCKRMRAVACAVAVTGALALGGCSTTPKTAQEAFARYVEASKGTESLHLAMDASMELELGATGSMGAGASMNFAVPFTMKLEGDVVGDEVAHGMLEAGTDLSFLTEALGGEPGSGAVDLAGELYWERDGDAGKMYLNADGDDEGWYWQEAAVSGVLGVATGEDASEDVLEHATFSEGDGTYEVSVDVRELMEDGDVRRELLKGLDVDARMLYKKLIESLEGQMRYRFDAETGLLTSTIIDDLTCSVEDMPGMAGASFGLTLDVTVEMSKFNEVDAEKVQVPDYVKDSAVPLPSDEGALSEELDGLGMDGLGADGSGEDGLGVDGSSVFGAGDLAA